jgi:hypothetical protein
VRKRPSFLAGDGECYGSDALPMPTMFSLLGSTVLPVCFPSRCISWILLFCGAVVHRSRPDGRLPQTPGAAHWSTAGFRQTPPVASLGQKNTLVLVANEQADKGVVE